VTVHQKIIKNKNIIYVGTNLNRRDKVIIFLHDSSIEGHYGILGTYQRVKHLFYWPKLRDTVITHVQQCTVCQLNKGEHVASLGLLQPILITEGPWSVLTMDFISGLPKSGGKDVLLVVIPEGPWSVLSFTHPSSPF
jgi:Integrase zinc binding domain